MIRVLKPGGWLEFMIIEKQWSNLGSITRYIKDSCEYLEIKNSHIVTRTLILLLFCFNFEFCHRLALTTLSARILNDTYFQGKGFCARKQIKETAPVGNKGGRIGDFVSRSN
jgi:hypothetical protein